MSLHNKNVSFTCFFPFCLVRVFHSLFRRVQQWASVDDVTHVWRSSRVGSGNDWVMKNVTGLPAFLPLVTQSQDLAGHAWAGGSKKFDQLPGQHISKSLLVPSQRATAALALRANRGIVQVPLDSLKICRCESELIGVIVKRVWEKVLPTNTITLSDSKEKLVGIEFRLRQMGLLLAPEEKDVRFIGIWGMGGVGKTTLARLVFERISHHFEVAEFLDVRKFHGPLVNLQKQVLSPVLKKNVSQVWDEYKGTFFIRKCLSNKKVLLVVDDVDSCDILEKLALDKSWFGDGSRIIVTTRDKRLLTERRIELSFELGRLNDNNALELFSHKAFEKDQPEEGFLELSKCFVDYAKGLPLALKTLGSSLYQRKLEEWNSTLESLRRIPNPTIFDPLKLSYDALNDLQQKIFLDIAFFYKGMEKGRVNQLLQYSYGFDILIVINVLIEKSLLTIDMHNNVGMHGLIEDMAWEIVRQDSREEPGLRSRLCHRNDIFHVFMKNMGTEAIKGIRLCLPHLEEADSSWNCECFSKMLKLMFLEFDNLIISSGPKFLDNSQME